MKAPSLHFVMLLNSVRMRKNSNQLEDEKMSKTLQCKAEEAKACCCVDVGTIIDGSDCAVDFSQVYADENLAQEALAYLTQKARDAESDPAVIESEIRKVETGYQLNAKFEFSCQAEAMIFQLSTR